MLLRCRRLRARSVISWVVRTTSVGVPFASSMGRAGACCRTSFFSRFFFVARRVLFPTPLRTAEETKTTSSATMEIKKNAHRLNRIFRKPKVMVAPRSWREEGDENHLHSGVSLALLNAMVQELTGEDKALAAAQQDPPSVLQEELAKRAARFGLPVEVSNGTGAGAADDGAALRKRMERFGSTTTTAMPALVVDEATLKAREARFKTQEGAAMDEAMQKRLARFGAAPAPVELKLSEADCEAMARRESRFASC
ncbi:hypothetical protein TRSC58_04343 [Trypanosoma rangeli SC58]|uniref:Uncharacterized protein n=1 Tax=Trypanosoma rangeli SC58 TaxID=429131 RepID=A0A061J3S5_TRYRA|nr:hypothetical protein TRSC58_04343 [Trypanosoma rangeli SC58]